MNNVCRRYFRGLSQETAASWNRFWFEPSDGFDLCVMRILAGAWALVWQLSYTPDLIRWFGPRGWFDAGVLNRWLFADSSTVFSGRLSFLFDPSPGVLWTFHCLSALVLFAFMIGFFTRVSAILALIVLLGYIHRAPFLCGATEVVLTMLVAYLCLTPCGQSLSWDARRRGNPVPKLNGWVTLGRRLLQVHLVAIYAIMALSKFGSPSWWNGDAIWWLTAQPLSRSLDFTALRQWPLLINVWTYWIVISEIAFVALVWNPWLRPLVMAATTVSWLSLGVAAGNFSLPLTMILANLVFVPSWFWKELIPGGRVQVGATGAG